MQLSFLGKTWDLALRNNFGLLISNVILSAALAGAIYVIVNNHERLVIVPPFIDSKLEISWDSANADYIKSFGLYMGTLVGNVTPKNAKFVTESMSQFLAPEIYAETRGQILSFMEDPAFRQGGFVVAFAPERVVYEPRTHKVYVIGNYISTVLGQKDISTQKQVVYEMEIVIRHGRPLVSRLASYQGNTPRTDEAVATETAEAKRRQDAGLPALTPKGALPTNMGQQKVLPQLPPEAQRAIGATKQETGAAEPVPALPTQQGEKR